MCHLVPISAYFSMFPSIAPHHLPIPLFTKNSPAGFEARTHQPPFCLQRSFVLPGPLRKSSETQYPGTAPRAHRGVWGAEPPSFPESPGLRNSQDPEAKKAKSRHITPAPKPPRSEWDPLHPTKFHPRSHHGRPPHGNTCYAKNTKQANTWPGGLRGAIKSARPSELVRGCRSVLNH